MSYDASPFFPNERLILFGFGAMGRRVLRYYSLRKDTKIVAIADNYAFPDPSDPLRTVIPLIRPEDLPKYEYDRILVTNEDSKPLAAITQQLKALHIPENKISYLYEVSPLRTEILVSYNEYEEETDPRVRWLCNFAQYSQEKGLAGNTAECGVYHGDFSFFINKYFPDKTLYLFDTFEGFTADDLEAERRLQDKMFLDSQFNDKEYFAHNNVEIVERKLLHFEKCVVKKGFFPETTAGIEDIFCFVMLDMDLYQPMLAGIEWFYPRMEPGGVLLLHDYFHPNLPGVRQAVHDYEQKRQVKLCTCPIGDFGSLAIIKP